MMKYIVQIKETSICLIDFKMVSLAFAQIFKVFCFVTQDLSVTGILYASTV